VASGFIDNSQPSAVRIFPNPTHSDVILEVFLEQRTEVLLSVSDINGQTVVEENFTHPGGGNYSMRLDFRDMNVPEGIYFLRIQSEEFITVHKIIYIP
jgi:hypothetical protein